MGVGYRDLSVWQKSMDLVEEIYRIVKFLPKEETYALSDQMRRAAISVPSNIAEGKTRNTLSEYKYFLSIARGSLSELNTQLLICQRLSLVPETELQKALSLCEEAGRMLFYLLEKLNASSKQ